MMTRSGDHRERPVRQHFETPSSGYSSCKGCCCCVFLLLSSLALLVLAALLVIALAVKPKKPELNLQQVEFQYMAITPNPSDPTTATTLSLTVLLLFTMANPNRVGIRCGESRFTLMYREILLGKATVSRFCQQPHSVREVVATVAVDGVSLPPVDAADLTRDAWLNDRVELRVLGNVAAKIRLVNLDSPRLQVSVDCVIVLSPRKQSLTYKQCGLHGLNV